MEQIRELKESFVAQRDALSTALPDGRRLYTGQYEALEKFASNNKLDVQNRFITISVGGLQLGLWTARLVQARGLALVSSGPNSKPDRFVLSNRGKKPNVVLAADSKLRPTGPQSNAEFTIEVLPDIVLPMGIAN
jgi:hypothetical protein